jgi:hypothetical protein
MGNDIIQENLENIQTDNKGQQSSQVAGEGNALLIKDFNDILEIHIEHLLGTKNGIDELALNVFSIACVVLLASRETEIETFPALPPPRYTEAILIEELAEMSIEPASEIIKVIEDMIDKNYVRINDERLFCNKPMISMAQLFDKIFPNMPGLNFVAYLGQMIDEVTANRKSHDEASRQFNQMLTIQGVSVNEAAKPTKKKFTHLKLGDDSPADKKVKRQTVIPVKPVDIFSQLKTDKVIKPSPVSKNTQPIPTATQELSDARVSNVDQESGLHSLPETAEPVKDITTVKDNPDIELPTHEVNQHDAVSEDFEPLDDREIEDRILEFEAQLGLKCPLCGIGGIKTSETAKGKTYYHCSDSGCNFISWGKPYYIDCPKCGSNFLIEFTDSSRKSFLKCPKATCTHWQKFPWEISEANIGDPDGVSNSGDINSPKRLVRRRRVVRRKR